MKTGLFVWLRFVLAAIHSAEAQHSVRRILEHDLPTLIDSTVEQISKRIVPDLESAWRIPHRGD
jgi:hypothetical protein